TGEMELFDDIFTEDAVCDYTQSGGPKTSYPELRDWLVEGMKRFTHWQHLLSNLVVTVDGDRATARTDVFNPNAAPRPDGSWALIKAGATYHDELRRTPAGWRIFQRTLSMVWYE